MKSEKVWVPFLENFYRTVTAFALKMKMEMKISVTLVCMISLQYSHYLTFQSR